MIIDDYFYERFIKNPEKGTQRIFNFLSKIGDPQKKLNNIVKNQLNVISIIDYFIINIRKRMNEIVMDIYLWMLNLQNGIYVRENIQIIHM